MGRKCNLELRLSLASSVDEDGGDHNPLCLSGPSTNQQHCLTILHNGQISVSDVTELHARAIIWWASQCLTQEELDHYPKVHEGIRLQFLVQPTIQGLSMKKSLQRFLQKRNRRIQSTLPYYRR